jgi:hypothetical protein
MDLNSNTLTGSVPSTLSGLRAIKWVGDARKLRDAGHTLSGAVVNVDMELQVPDTELQPP